MKNENIELASVGKASSVPASNPFGPLGGGGFKSAPKSPTKDVTANFEPAVPGGSNPNDNKGAFKTMKNWWAGEVEGKTEEGEEGEEGGGGRREKEIDGTNGGRCKGESRGKERTILEQAHRAPFQHRIGGQ